MAGNIFGLQGFASDTRAPTAKTSTRILPCQKKQRCQRRAHPVKKYIDQIELCAHAAVVACAHSIVSPVRRRTTNTINILRSRQEAAHRSGS